MFTRVNLNIFSARCCAHVIFPVTRCGRREKCTNKMWKETGKKMFQKPIHFIFPLFSSCSSQTQVHIYDQHTQENVLPWKNEWKREQFLSFVYVSCFFFLGIFRVISWKTHLFLQYSGQQCLPESIFDTNRVCTQFFGHKINYTRWTNRPKFNFPIFYATTVHRSMEIQFHQNWFSLFAFTVFIKWIKFPKILL